MIDTKEELRYQVTKLISSTEKFMDNFPEEPDALLCRAYSTLIVDYMSLFTAWYRIDSGNPNGGANGISMLNIAGALRQYKDARLDTLRYTSLYWKGTQVTAWSDVREEIKKLNTYRISVCHYFSNLVEFRVTQSTQHVMSYLLCMLCEDIDASTSVDRINLTVGDLATIIEATAKGI